MADTHSCIICKKNRAGRFTRRNSGASGAWTKGSLPAWHCWACLPKGQGRGESEEEAVTVTLPAKALAPVSPKAILLDRKEGMDKIQPLQLEVSKLSATLSTPEEYEIADIYLGKIQSTRKWWKSKLYGTKALPGPIPSIKSGLDMLYALNNEVDHPLAALEEGIKGRMKEYVRRKLLMEQKQERDRIEMEQRAARELEEAAAKEAAAKTPAQKAKAAVAVAEAEEAYIETLTPVTEQQVVANSTTRVPKKPVVKDLLAFCKGISDGEIPTETIRLMPSVLNQLFRDDAEMVAGFPGVSIEDDIQIVGR